MPSGNHTESIPTASDDTGYRPTRVKRGSIINQAAEEICQLITGKKLRPGDALPPETLLAKMLGLSRNSVREAIRMLHGMGVINKIDGHRAIVTAASTAGWGDIDQTTLLEAAEIANEVRILTMQKCAELAAKKFSDDQLTQLKEEFSILESAVERGDRVSAKRAHDTFYGLVLGGAANALLASIFKQADSARLTALYMPSNKTFIADQHLEHHRQLLDSLLKRDQNAAGQAVRRHYLALGRMIKLLTSSNPSSAKLKSTPTIESKKAARKARDMR